MHGMQKTEHLKSCIMKGVSEDLYNKILNEIDLEREHFEEHNMYYCPNSVWHGTLYSHGRFKPETLLKHQIHDLTDFLEYLFDQSEHLNHILYREAYEEFEVYQRINK